MDDVRTMANSLRARHIVAVFAALAGLGLVGCETVGPDSLQQRVFADPASFVGREVNVCGHLVHGNIFERRTPPRRGLATAVEDEALEQAVVRRWGSRTCLRGTIFFAGCETRNACLEWAFDYGIMVRRVFEGAATR